MEIVSSELKVVAAEKNIIKAEELNVVDPENADEILKANIIEVEEKDNRIFKNEETKKAD